MPLVPTYTAILPVEMPDNVEPPKPPSPDVESAWAANTAFTNETDSQDVDYTPNIENDRPTLLSQNEIDYLVAKLGL